MRNSKIARVHVEFADEIDRLWKKNNREISKVSLTRQIARQMRAMGRKQPKYVVNYWPLSRKKVKVY